MASSQKTKTMAVSALLLIVMLAAAPIANAQAIVDGFLTVNDNSFEDQAVPDEQSAEYLGSDWSHSTTGVFFVVNPPSLVSPPTSAGSQAIFAFDASAAGTGLSQQLSATYQENVLFTFSALLGRSSESYSSNVTLSFRDNTDTDLATLTITEGDLPNATQYHAFELMLRGNTGDAFLGDNVTIAINYAGSSFGFVVDDIKVYRENDT